LEDKTCLKELLTSLHNSKVNKQVDYLEIINSNNSRGNNNSRDNNNSRGNSNNKVDYFKNSNPKDKHKHNKILLGIPCLVISNKGDLPNKVRYLAIHPNNNSKDNHLKVLYLVIHSSKSRKDNNSSSQVVFLLEVV